MVVSPAEYVFVNRAGRKYTTDGVRSIFRRAVQRAAIENFRFHDLRHSVATRLRQHGVGIDAIAEVLGHSTLAMARRYAHIGAETMRAAMATLDTTPPDSKGVTALEPHAGVG